MSRKLNKKLTPYTDHVRGHKFLDIFGPAIKDPNLWHLNRYSVSRAMAIGLFCAFMPIPSQMVLAAALAIIFRSNLPISVLLVWVSNPFTMPAMFYGAYKLGTLILGTELQPFQFELSLNWLFTELRERWKPFLVGCLCSGALAGALGYISMRLYWRWYVTTEWAKRKSKIANKKVSRN